MPSLLLTPQLPYQKKKVKFSRTKSFNNTTTSTADSKSTFMYHISKLDKRFLCHKSPTFANYLAELVRVLDWEPLVPVLRSHHLNMDE